MNQQNRFRFRKNQDTNSSQSEFIEQSNLGPIGQDELSFNTLLDGATGTTGRQGNTGPQGQTGRQGNTGPQGQTGRQGNTGPQGTQGITGPAGGPQGPTGPLGGPAGPQGLRGNTGGTGSQGNTGSQGSTGVQGPTGNQGVTGTQGRTGVQGVTGPQGTGVQGVTGAQGRTGVQGITGSQGRTGVQGVTGIQGNTGVLGNTGTQGFTGPQGLVGLVGSTGIPGPTGPAGGPQGPTGPAGGPPGAQGPQGLRGNTGAVVVINSLPISTPSLTSSVMFETLSGTSSRNTLLSVFETLQTLTASSDPGFNSRFIMGFDNRKVHQVSYDNIRSGFRVPNAWMQLLYAFNATQVSSDIFGYTRVFDTGQIDLTGYGAFSGGTNSIYYYAKLFNQHATDPYTGLRIDMDVEMKNGRSGTQSDELVLTVYRDFTEASYKIIATSSTFNVANSRYNIQIDLFTYTDYELHAIVNTTQYSRNNYQLDGFTVSGMTLHETKGYSIPISDGILSDAFKIRLNIPNGNTSGNQSRISKLVMSAYMTNQGANWGEPNFGEATYPGFPA